MTEPRVVQIRASARENDPRLAERPAIGRITSLGSGGKMFSSAIARPAPAGPMISMSETDQSMRCVIQEPSGVAVCTPPRYGREVTAGWTPPV